MPRAAVVEPVQAFLDEEGPQLRRVALLALGSWPAADEVLRELTAELVRRRVDLDDLPRATGHARRLLCQAVLRRAVIGGDPTAPPPPAEDTPAAHLAAALATVEVTARVALVLRRFAHLGDHQAGDALGVATDRVPDLVEQGLTELGAALRALGDELQLDPQPQARPGADVVREEFHA